MVVDRGGLQAFLHSAVELDERSWFSNFSHVAHCDAVGFLSLEDGRSGRWLLRPGGLCQIHWSDGRYTYLVGNLADRPPC